MQDEDSTQKYYKIHAEEYARKEFSYQPVPMLEPFEKLLPRKAYVLEVGGGAGRDARWLTTRGHRILDIDISEPLLKMISNVPGVQSQLKDMREITWKKEFDGATALSSLMHVSRAECLDVLQRISRALKQGGFFLASVTEGTGEYFDFRNRFFVNYTSTEFETMAAAAGFKLLSPVQPDDRNQERRFLHFLFQKGLPGA